MSWSIFSDGGGAQAAVQWARDMLAEAGAVCNDSTLTFVYRWCVSEGGGGKHNPLNQGPVPGHPEWTSTGQQYGGGASDFVSREAGIHGAVAYLNMGNYSGILAALKRGDGVGARSALIASPWAASHYGWGANFSRSPLPGGPLPVPQSVIGDDMASLAQIHGQSEVWLVGGVPAGRWHVPDAATRDLLVRVCGPVLDVNAPQAQALLALREVK